MKRIGIIGLFILLISFSIFSVSVVCAEVGDVTSGIIMPSNDSLNIASSLEFDTDRPGMNYKDFDLSKADYLLCSSACASDEMCKAWTYVKPGVQKLNIARCWLKNGIPPKKPSKHMLYFWSYEIGRFH